MPEPLPKAAMRTWRGRPLDAPGTAAAATSMWAKAVFSTVSVVRMALAASMKRSDSAPMEAARSGNTAIIFSAGSGAPMTPVEEGNTSSVRQAKAWAAAAHTARAASRPAWPAAQLALPALMATTRTLPPVARKCSLSRITGAATTRFDVNAAAALAGASATITAKSVRPLALRPALAAPKRKP